jgi:hypothetical protein
MRKSAVICTLVVLVFGLASTAYWLRPTHGLVPVPITIGDVVSRDSSGQASFSVTKHTPKEVVVVLTSIEVRSGSTWRASFQMPQSICILSTEHGHLASTTPPPTDAPWRIRGVVEETLTGPRAFLAKLMMMPRMILIRWRTGKTNLSLNPFRSDWTVLGNKREFLSQEFPAQ